MPSSRCIVPKDSASAPPRPSQPERQPSCTDYSSTSEFINEQTGYPVAFTLEPVRPGEYVHTEGQVWANPNLDAAVEALRAIYNDPAEADARARRGFALLQERHSTVNVGGRSGNCSTTTA